MEQDEFPEEKKSQNKPEFIYVETEHYDEGHEFGGFQKEFQQSYQKMETKNYPAAVRMVCFVCSFFLILFLLLAAPFLLLFVGINLLTFFQLKLFWEKTVQLWSMFKRMFVTALGLLIAVLSPAFGLSVIMVYFMMSGGNYERDWVARVFKNRFRQ